MRFRYISLLDNFFDKNKFEHYKVLISTEEYKNIKPNIVKNNLELSLVKTISQFISKSKPKLLIMFTKREMILLRLFFCRVNLLNLPLPLKYQY